MQKTRRRKNKNKKIGGTNENGESKTHTHTHAHTHTHDPFVSTRIEPEQAITLLPDMEKKLISDIVKKGVVKQIIVHGETRYVHVPTSKEPLILPNLC